MMKTLRNSGFSLLTVVLAVLVFIPCFGFAFVEEIPVTPIPYLLDSDARPEYDSDGNLIDRSNYLISIGDPSDVYPLEFDLNDVPYYYGVGVIEINHNVPFFTDEELALALNGSFEYYGDLDRLGRCTVAFDCLSSDTMPHKANRGNISSIHPSGWKQARYDCVNSETVMTRAHLAGYMLSTENANPQNLITGTRYMNSDTMLPYEEAVANWLGKYPKKHVLYRVTPWFEDDNLMADGILMEAMSVEDLGKSLQFCVYVYNVQPGVQFNYRTGRSEYSGIFFDTASDSVVTSGLKLRQYGLDLNTYTVHSPNCSEYKALGSEEKALFYGDKSMVCDWPELGYALCEDCMD